MRILCSFFKCMIIFFFISTTNAGKQIKSEAYEPYFVSLKVSKANSHVGPGINYKNANKYQIKWTPLLVIAIYDTWRKIQDITGSTGWLKQSQLSTKRYVMVKKQDCILFEKPDENSKPIAILKREVIMKLKQVNNDWCCVTVIINGKPKYTGYVRRENIFGLLDNEIYIKK